jgi:hypothetical protein
MKGEFRTRTTLVLMVTNHSVSISGLPTLKVERVFVYVLVQDKQRSILRMTMQQFVDTMTDSPTTLWTDLSWTDPPEYLYEAMVEHLQGHREASANFRHVCHAWQEAHDRLVSVLKPKGTPRDARVWAKFGGVKTLKLGGMKAHMNASLVSEDDLRGLLALTGLTSLDLHSCYGFIYEGLMSLSLLTTLTHLDLGDCDEGTDKGAGPAD